MSKKPSQKSSNQKRPVNIYIRYSNMAFQLFAAIFLGVWGGMKLDSLWGTDPWLTVVLSLFGVAAGLYSVLKEFLKS